MKVYLFRFDTNYEEGGIIITTDKGLEYAKEQADILGAWHTNEVIIIDTETEGAIDTVNYRVAKSNLNDW